jgi:hypothetical protein
MTPLQAQLIVVETTLPLSHSFPATLELRGTGNWNWTMPRLTGDLQGSWRIRPSGPVQYETTAEVRVARLPLRIEPLRAGQQLPLELPPVQVEHEGRTVELFVPPISLDIRTIITAESAPRPLWQAPATAGDPSWLLAVVGFLLTLAFVMLLIRRVWQRPRNFSAWDQIEQAHQSGASPRTIALQIFRTLEVQQQTNSEEYRLAERYAYGQKDVPPDAIIELLAALRADSTTTRKSSPLTPP